MADLGTEATWRLTAPIPESPGPPPQRQLGNAALNLLTRVSEIVLYLRPQDVRTLAAPKSVLALRCCPEPLSRQMPTANAHREDRKQLRSSRVRRPPEDPRHGVPSLESLVTGPPHRGNEILLRNCCHGAWKLP